MKNAVCLGFIALVLAIPPAAAADEESPYLYQRLPGAAPVRVEAETAIGSRDARPFGERGVEETLRVAFRPLPRLEVVLSGSSLFVDGAVRGGGVLEASYAVLDGAFKLRLGAGAGVDLTDTTILRARVVAARAFGRVELVGSALVELPVAAPARDGADIMLGVALSVRVLPRLRAGVELLGEDLEGLFDDEEAEGGARFLAGPTLWVGLSRSVDLKLSAAVTTVVGKETGLLARAALGISF